MTVWAGWGNAFGLLQIAKTPPSSVIPLYRVPHLFSWALLCTTFSQQATSVYHMFSGRTTAYCILPTACRTLSTGYSVLATAYLRAYLRVMSTSGRMLMAYCRASYPWGMSMGMNELKDDGLGRMGECFWAPPDS